MTPANQLARAKDIAGAVRFSDLASESIPWLWPDRIPLSRITLLVSEPGLGKSLLALDIAARVSTGKSWPDEETANTSRADCRDQEEELSPSSPQASPPPSLPISPSLHSPASVLLLTAEDEFADTVRPRLDALGADCDRILGISTIPGDDPYGVPRSFALKRDLARLRSLVDAIPDCRLIVIDPINAYLGNTNSDVQSILHSLTTIARERGIAVLIVSQLRKKDGAAVYRAMGSVAFVAASRASWAICKDPVDERKRLFLPVKNNLAPHVSGLTYTIEPGPDPRAPTLRWSPDPVTQSVEFAIARVAGRPNDERQHAIDWLRDRLGKGPRPTEDLKEEAEANGIAFRTLRRAFRDLDGDAFRRGPFPFGQWNWKLPGVDGQNPAGDFWTSTDFFDQFTDLVEPFPPPPTPNAHPPSAL